MAWTRWMGRLLSAAAVVVLSWAVAAALPGCRRLKDKSAKDAKAKVKPAQSQPKPTYDLLTKPEAGELEETGEGGERAAEEVEETDRKADKRAAEGFLEE